MKIDSLITRLKEYGIETTAAEVKARLGSVFAIQESDIPSVVEVWHQSLPGNGPSISKIDGPNLAPSGKSSSEMELPGKSAVPRSVPVPGSRIDRKAFEESIAGQIAQPLVDANAQIDALEAGVAAAAEHLHQRKQEILDSFFERVAAPVETQSLRHFFSQIPEELKEFFP